MSLIGDIKSFFSPAPRAMVFDQNRVEGILYGAAVGEAMGIPVVGKTVAALAENPVTDLLGFGDGMTPAGTTAACTESLVDFVKYLIDNHNDGYEASRFFRLCNSWYLYKAKDEDERLRVMLPCAAVAGVVASRLDVRDDEVLPLVSDLICDTGVAPSSLVYYAAKSLAQGYGLREAWDRGRNLHEQLCRRIGLVAGERMSPWRLLLDAVAGGLDVATDFGSGLLDTVNRGVYTDISGNISGILLGMFYGMENIPYLWRSSVGGYSQTSQLSAGLNNILR